MSKIEELLTAVCVVLLVGMVVLVQFNKRIVMETLKMIDLTEQVLEYTDHLLEESGAPPRPRPKPVENDSRRLTT